MSAITQSLPAALALIVGSSPILALVLLLVNSRSERTAWMFLLGWVAGVVLTSSVLVVFVDMTVRPALPPTAAGVVRIVLGALLGALAIRSWRRGRDSDVPPQWISSAAGWSGRRALTVGLVLATLNPKSLALVAAGATAILGATTVLREQVVALVVFAIVGSLGLAAPVVLKAVGGRAVERGLERVGNWMAAHGKLLSSGVVALIAVALIVSGISRL